METLCMNNDIQELNIESMIEINGGVQLGKLTPAGIALWIVSNWADVKKGLIDGWNEN